MPRYTLEMLTVPRPGLATVQPSPGSFAGVETEDIAIPISTPAPAPAPSYNGYEPPVVTTPYRQPYVAPIPAPVVPAPVVPEELPVTNGINGVAEELPGAETDGVAPSLAGIEAAPVGFPLVAPALAGVAMLSFGFLKRFFFRYGARALKLLIGVAAFKEFMDLLGIGAPDDAMIRIRKNGKRRYSIGSNPRVGTLQKVSRHCQRLLKRHEKVIREFLPKRAPRYGIPPARALSAIEKAAIRGT